MKQNRLKLYFIDMKYIRDLSKVDDNVMSVSPQINKERRPFVGIVVVCDSKKYCIPLSSPKKKHNEMKNDIDFMKILDKEKLIGVLNFNNMIPVNENVIRSLDLKIRQNDDDGTKYYKKMAMKQLSWCQKNQEIIMRKANKLYNMIVLEKANFSLKKRCCNFLKLEIVLDEKYKK